VNQVSPYVVAAITFAVIYSAIDLLWAVIMNRKVDFPLFQSYLDRPVIPSKRWEGWGFKGVRRSGQPDQREATEGAQEAREAAALGFHGTISSWWASLRGNRQTSEQPQPTRQEREEEARRQFAETEARRQAEEEAKQAERRDRP
jgi:hypothetical protein